MSKGKQILDFVLATGNHNLCESQGRCSLGLEMAAHCRCSRVGGKWPFVHSTVQHQPGGVAFQLKIIQCKPFDLGPLVCSIVLHAGSEPLLISPLLLRGSLGGLSIIRAKAFCHRLRLSVSRGENSRLVFSQS